MVGGRWKGEEVLLLKFRRANSTRWEGRRGLARRRGRHAWTCSTFPAELARAVDSLPTRTARFYTAGSTGMSHGEGRRMVKDASSHCSAGERGNCLTAAMCHTRAADPTRGILQQSDPDSEHRLHLPRLSTRMPPRACSAPWRASAAWPSLEWGRGSAQAHVTFGAISNG